MLQYIHPPIFLIGNLLNRNYVQKSRFWKFLTARKSIRPTLYPDNYWALPSHLFYDNLFTIRRAYGPQAIKMFKNILEKLKLGTISKEGIIIKTKKSFPWYPKPSNYAFKWGTKSVRKRRVGIFLYKICYRGLKILS